MHVYVKLANFTAKPRFENLVACFRGSSDSKARRSVGNELNCTPGKRGGGREQGGCPHFFFFVNFSAALYYLNAWNKLKILPLVKLFSDLRAPSSTSSNFHSIICLISLLGVKKNCSGVTNSPLQAKKAVSKGKKEGKFTTNKKTRDWCHVGVVTSWFEVDGGVTDFRDKWRERSRGHFLNYLDGLWCVTYISELTQQDGRGKKTANLVWQAWQ